MVEIKLEYDELERLLQSYDFIDDFEASVIADYIDECIDFELDFNQYVWNVVPFSMVCLKGGKEEALKYIEDNLCCDVEDCIIYECKEVGGTYLEWT